MPLQIVELFDSREADIEVGRGSVSLKYGVVGSEDDADVHAIVAATLPSSYLTLSFQSYRIEHKGAGVWLVTARYGSREPREVGYSAVQFETGGGTQHITQNLSNSILTKAAGVTGDVPDFKGAIGVNGDQVEGCDIYAPAFSFSETHILSDDVVTNSFIIMLRDLTATTNTDSFRGFAAGEVLFIGASGSKRSATDWEITFKFLVGKNRTDVVINGSAPFPKGAWEYLWVKYEDGISNTNLIKKPKYIYVERVYESRDFFALGIGV
jgi:hypothetical protein